MVDLLSVPPRGRKHLVLRVDAGLRGGELRRPLGGVFAARTNEYGRKMNGELSGLRTPRVLPLAGGGSADRRIRETDKRKSDMVDLLSVPPRGRQQSSC